MTNDEAAEVLIKLKGINLAIMEAIIRAGVDWSSQAEQWAQENEAYDLAVKALRENASWAEQAWKAFEA